MDYDDLRAKAQAARSEQGKAADVAWREFMAVASDPSTVLALLDRVEELKAALRRIVSQCTGDGSSEAAVDRGDLSVEAYISARAAEDGVADIARSVLGEDSE